MISKCPKCRKMVSIPAGVDPADRVRCPLCNAEYALSEALALAPPELIPVVRIAAEPPAVPVEIATAVSVGEPVGAPTESTSEPEPEAENEAAAVARQFPTMPVTARRRRKHKSPLQTVIEVIAGGLAGCIVAYYGLAFYYGPEFSLPKLPLPGIEKITAPRDSGEDAKDKPSEKPDKKPKGKAKAAGHGESTSSSSCSPGQNGIQLG
jgi:LSD1 subclass zinc finger protein